LLLKLERAADEANYVNGNGHSFVLGLIGDLRSGKNKWLELFLEGFLMVYMREMEREGRYRPRRRHGKASRQLLNMPKSIK